MKVTQGVLTDLHGFIVPPAADQPVADKVLRARCDRARVARALALEAADHCRAESAGKDRSLAQRLCYPAPSGFF